MSFAIQGHGAGVYGRLIQSHQKIAPYKGQDYSSFVLLDQFRDEAEARFWRMRLVWKHVRCRFGLLNRFFYGPLTCKVLFIKCIQMRSCRLESSTCIWNSRKVSVCETVPWSWAQTASTVKLQICRTHGPYLSNLLLVCPLPMLLVVHQCKGTTSPIINSCTQSFRLTSNLYRGWPDRG